MIAAVGAVALQSRLVKLPCTEDLDLHQHSRKVPHIFVICTCENTTEDFLVKHKRDLQMWHDH